MAWWERAEMVSCWYSGGGGDGGGNCFSVWLLVCWCQYFHTSSHIVIPYQSTSHSWYFGSDVMSAQDEEEDPSLGVYLNVSLNLHWEFGTIFYLLQYMVPFLYFAKKIKPILPNKIFQKKFCPNLGYYPLIWKRASDPEFGMNFHCMSCFLHLPNPMIPSGDIILPNKKILLLL